MTGQRGATFLPVRGRKYSIAPSNPARAGGLSLPSRQARASKKLYYICSKN
ncbi:MAG: hypothetical protein LBD64_04200 [Odoribacteraceae bacterium]|nr:hypothetical protein [Odoribacteraceae bacterium]